MKRSKRMTAAARRAAILRAVKELFAEKGFHATTTRDMARAAGVSEALLYKHFPSKKSMYVAIREEFKQGSTYTEYSRIVQLEPSTSTLVLLVHFLISHFVRNVDPVDRLMVRSLVEDGEFVRLLVRRLGKTWVVKFEACLKAAARAGELRELPVRPDLRSWFVQHIGVSLMLYLLPRNAAIDYNASKDALIENAVWFALSGTGVKETAIKRYYNPKALRLFVK